MSARELITEHMDLWTGAVTKKSSSGRGSNGKVELTGIKKLRAFILRLAVSGRLVEQDAGHEPVRNLRNRIAATKTKLIKAGALRKQKPSPPLEQDKVPFTAPETWEWVTFGEITFNRDAERIPLSVSDRRTRSGDFDYYGASGIIDKIDDYLFDSPLLLIGEDGANLINRSTPIAFIARGKYWVNNHAHVIDGISENFLKFLCLYINATSLEPYVTGTAQPKMNQAKMNSIPVPLPPEDEQVRIVQKVDELMALCDRLEQQTSDQLEAHETLVDTLLGTLTQSENATELADNWARLAAHFDTLFTTEQSIDRLKQTILQLAVMGRLVEQDVGDESAEELLEDVAQEKIRICAKQTKNNAAITDDEVLYCIPSGWRWARFGDVVTFKSELVRPEQYPEFDQVAPDSIEKGTARLLFRRTVEESGVRGPNHRFHRGQILYSKIRPSLSKAIIAPFDGLCSADMYPIQPILVEPRYLLQYILSEPFLGQVRVAENRVKMPKLNMPTMSNFLVALPPLAEQKRIVEKVDELTALCDQLKERLNQAGESRCQLAKAIVKGARHE